MANGCRYYILRDEMLADLTRTAGEQVQGNAPWQVNHLPVQWSWNIDRS